MPIREFKPIPFLFFALAAVCFVGCKSTNRGGSAAGGYRGPSTPEVMRDQAMVAADTYMSFIAQGCDTLRETTKRPEVAKWALKEKTATFLAALTDVTNPNESFCLLDMLVLATLNTQAIEDHWIPTFLHEEGTDLLQRYRKGEDQVWAIAGNVLTPQQLNEVRTLIEQWRRENPGQYYVANIRFSDFAAVRNLTPSSPQLKMPDSVFSLLYIDPAGLDPVAKEIQGYRDLTERLVFLAARMPIVLQWQVQLAVYDATETPEITRFVQNTGNFADATSRFADAVAKYPKEFSVERKAAIDQLMTSVTSERKASIDQLMSAVTTERKGALDQANTSVTAQREAILHDLDSQQSKLRQVVTDVDTVIENAKKAGDSLQQSTNQTVSLTEQATRRTLDHAFLLAVILILLLIVGIPTLLVLYRLASRRWPRAASPPHETVA